MAAFDDLFEESARLRKSKQPSRATTPANYCCRTTSGGYSDETLALQLSVKTLYPPREARKRYRTMVLGGRGFPELEQHWGLHDFIVVHRHRYGVAMN